MAKAHLKKGFFITFEGIEGCGKSTHSRLLLKYLEGRGYKCVLTREPGGTKLGEEVRKVLLKSNGFHISDLTELFLFEACRSQIVRDIIKPALQNKYIVICDRFSDATFSYQGYGGRIGLDVIRTLDNIATCGLKPDLTILLDIDTREGLKRAKKKGTDRIESKKIVYHNRVRAGYLKLAAKYPGRIKTVKVDGEIAEVQLKVRAEVENVIR